MATTRTTLIGMLVALTIPSAAMAKNTAGLPTGNSGAYQYVETIPTAGGSKADSGVHTRTGPTPSQVPSATQKTLQRDGSAGQAAFSMAADTAPKAVSHARHAQSRRGHVKRRTTKHAATVSSASGGGPTPPPGASRASALIGAISGVGADGSGLGLLIALFVVAAGAVALRLRRRAPADPADSAHE